MMPSAPFDQFQRLDKSIMWEGDDEAARDFWDRLSGEWDRCVDGVEEELIGRPGVSLPGVYRQNHHGG